MEDNTPKNKELAIMQPQQLAKYEPKNYIAVVPEADTLEDCKIIIDKALLFKGNNKTETEAGLMAIMFKEKIKKSYSHLTIQQIDEVLFDNNYGEGFGVSVMSLVGALEKSELQRKNTENKKKLAIQAEAEYLKALDDKRIKDFELNGGKRIKQRCLDRYEDWKKRGEFVDLFNETYTRILKHPVLKNEHCIKSSKKVATERAKSQISIKKDKESSLLNFDTVKFLNSLLKDRKLLEEQDSYIFFFKHEMVKCYFSYRLKQENENKTK